MEKPLPALLRVASPLLLNEEPQIDAAQKASMSFEICERMAGTPTRELYTSLTQVYPRKTIMNPLRQWILLCSEPQAKSISRLAQHTSFNAIEKETIQMAYQTNKQRTSISDERRKTFKDKEKVWKGIASSHQNLRGTLEVPVLFPLPEVKWPKEDYTLPQAYETF